MIKLHCALVHWLYQTVSQSTNQPINQSINQPINQSINQLIDQSIDQSIKSRAHKNGRLEEERVTPIEARSLVKIIEQH